MGIFDQVKEAMKMRSDAKRMQNEIEKIVVTYANGGITAAVKGDFTLDSLTISPDTWKEVSGGKTERFETMLKIVLNGALKSAKKEVQSRMAQLMGGADGLLGGKK